MPATAIKSKQIITPRGAQAGAVVIEGGKITDIVDNAPDGVAIVDVGNHILMPGIVDPHVHINEPGRTEWEGFETATKAAIAGGITTLVDMPLNSSPVTTTVGAFEEKLVAAKGKINCNVGFWGGVIPGNENEIEPLIEKGVLGFKAFLTHSGIDEFPNVTEDDLEKAMPLIAKYGLPLLVHAELSDGSRKPVNNSSSYQNYLSSRPRYWEDGAIALMIRLCEQFNCRTHIVHLSSSNSIEQITKAKKQGLPITCETGQHYLYFNAESIPDGRTEYKCAPPIREKENNEKLWQALKDGVIDFVATDHSPAPPEMKQLESGDFMKAWGGISGIQFALSTLWTAGRKHGADIEDMAKWLCMNPALLPGLGNRKGKIEKGYDADLIVWNPEETFVVQEGMIQHRHKITPYLGEELFGVVKQTWLGGELVVDNGKFLHLNKGHIVFIDT
jgi:allantoinase